MNETKTAERVRTPRPFAAPNVFVLAVIEGNDPSVAYRVAQHDTVIGRGDEAHFSIEDEGISQQHCMLRVNGSVCTLLDKGSTNGTSVNGRRLREGVGHRLRHLDEIQIGETHLMLLAGCFKNRPAKR
jgi:pSer/pThr/pTyr-binding forkhead associated (FHA) protein